MKEELDGLEKEFGSDCRRKEALGIAALVIAEMKGLNRHDGVPIRRHNKRFNHLNTAEEGDYVYIQNVFQFLTRRILEINVIGKNDLNFDEHFKLFE